MLLYIYIFFFLCFNLRIAKKLEDIEKKHSIISRWTPSDKEYCELQQLVAAEKKEQLLRAIWKAAKRRAFLLKLKAKYAGMFVFVCHLLLLFFLCVCESINSSVFTIYFLTVE